MDYIYTSIHHPYSSGDLPYWPLSRAFPHGVNLGTSGVPNPPRSVAARLLDMEADSFPSKYERRQELDRLKSRRRLENTDWGLLPHDSYSVSLHPTHYYPIRTSYSASDVRVPFRPATPLGRYQVRPHHLLSVAPLSHYRLPMPDPSLDSLTIDYEKEEARIQAAKEARRQQSVRWQSEATDRLLRQCREKNRARNFQRRVDNARLVAPIFMSQSTNVGTRSKVLINYHKGAGEQAAADKESPPVSGRTAAAARREERQERRQQEEPAETVSFKKDSIGSPPILNGVCDDDEDNTVTEQVTIGLHRPKKAEEEPKATEESANITITLPPMRRSSSIKVEEPPPVEEVEACASIVIGAPASKPSSDEPVDVTEEATIDLSNLPKEEEDPKPVEKKKKTKREEKAAAAATDKKSKDKKIKEPEPVAEPPAAPTPEPEPPVVEEPPAPEPIPEPAPLPETVSKPADDDLGTTTAEVEEEVAPTVSSPPPPSEPEPEPEPEPTPEVVEEVPPSPVPETVEQPSEVVEETPEPVVEETPEVVEEAPKAVEEQPETVEEPPALEKEEEQVTIEEVVETPQEEPEPPQAESTEDSVAEKEDDRAAEDSSNVAAEETSQNQNGEVAAEEEENGGISRSSSGVRRLVSVVSYREGDSCDPDEWEADDAAGAEEPELDYSFSEGSETTRERIVLSASDDAIADRITAAAAAARGSMGGNAGGEEEPTSTAEEDTVVEAYDADVALLNAGGDLDGGTGGGVSASTNEPNAEAGDNETLSVNGESRPLSIDAESLVTDDENVLDDALLDSPLGKHKNTNDPYDPPAEDFEEETD